jgi:type II secretory ATPase GspE/PulE/Tfp pilus assembly ATPase PilB-like protein
LTDAVKRESSDIHFEPEHAFLRIRYRIDGVLEQIRSLHKTYWPGILVRLKVLSGMNIAETRAPQDGRMSLTLNGRPIDFRVSSQPGIHGENLVLRILDREKSIMPLEQMGFTTDALRELQLMMARPEGILVVTGPTGSGKTTTLYSMLSHLNNETVNIMTLEDPVEYPVTLMRQSSVNETLKLDFANGIRSIMRQDPDIILVGEIRDKDTAEMAFRAAMTGHQVFTTLHTNSALGVFPRLMDIGIQPGILSGNIIGVVAQRLVRKLCSHCREAYTPDEDESRILGVDPAQPPQIYRAAGCPACGNKGYRGRLALIELLRMDPGARRAGRQPRAAARNPPRRIRARLPPARRRRGQARAGWRDFAGGSGAGGGFDGAGVRMRGLVFHPSAGMQRLRFSTGGVRRLRFSPLGESLSFASPKESNQRKGDPTSLPCGFPIWRARAGAPPTRPGKGHTNVPVLRSSDTVPLFSRPHTPNRQR